MRVQAVNYQLRGVGSLLGFVIPSVAPLSVPVVRVRVRANPNPSSNSPNPNFNHDP